MPMIIICFMFAATLHLTRANIHILSTIIASSIHATHAYYHHFRPGLNNNNIIL